ncbi:hypothetical protein QQW46_001197 [Escherichia coli]|nr:hypothetical protein [Escherichia coli]
MQTSNEPRWLVEGRKYIGQMEIKGPRHNPLILQFWKDIKHPANSWVTGDCRTNEAGRSTGYRR